jgi:hypothetical protein
MMGNVILSEAKNLSCHEWEPSVAMLPQDDIT